MAKSILLRERQSFPQGLLDLSNEARLNSFKTYTIAHPALATADQAVWNAIREPAGAFLIFVFGPTGVGKTTLLAHIEQRLQEQALLRMEQDPTHIPSIRLDVVAPALQGFGVYPFCTDRLPRSNCKIFSGCAQ
jgi:Cdc6-like AAA superfamily ATPase